MVKLIEGVELKQLKKNKDERGYLCELLRRDWSVFKEFAMAYSRARGKPASCSYSPYQGPHHRQLLARDSQCINTLGIKFYNMKTQDNLLHILAVTDAV
jgi:hypothetical protein